jgi:hypothetical protein
MKFGVSFLVTALCALQCLAQRSVPQQVDHPTALWPAKFGDAVAVSGDTMIVGALEDNVWGISNQGSAHIYHWTGVAWAFEATLSAADGAENDYFGYSVAISGDTVIVGVAGDNFGANVNQGSAYVFVRSDTTWTQQAKLTAADGANSDQFGISVALDGDTALVGANYTEIDGTAYQGSAYVFFRSGTSWMQQAKLTAADGSLYDVLGVSIALDGDTAVVGAIGDQMYRGSAYIFERSGATWTQQAKLNAADSTPYDFFGHAVALSGDTAVVTAFADDVGTASDQGSAYVFIRTGTSWTQQAQLIASGGAASDQFGDSVAISRGPAVDTVVVGASNSAISANSSQGSASIFTRSGATWTQQLQINAAAGEAGDRFGSSVAISGNKIAVGVPFNDSLTGSVFVYSRIGDSWVAPDTQILASDGAASDFFGRSASVSGDYAVVGANLRDVGGNNAQGAAYVYKRSGHQWIQQAVLVALDGATGDNFGQSVSISGDTIVVGADRNDHGGAGNVERGAAYVFTRSGMSWTQQAKLIAPDAANNDQFGFSVAVDANTAVVGSYLNDVGANNNQGSAYIYLRTGTTWAFVAQLTAADGAAGDYFGFSVAISGNTFLAGAYFDNVGANVDQGSAYVFTKFGFTWSQQAKLTASDGAATDDFGWSVSLSGDTALVGAIAVDVNGQNASGAAYAFTRSGTVWTQQQRIVPPDPTANDNFGFAVALSGNAAIIGSPLKDISGNTNQGAVSIFTRVGTRWFYQFEVVDPNGTANSSFGRAIGLSAGTAFVGAPNQTLGANTNQGSARALDVPYDDCRGTYNETYSTGHLTLSDALFFAPPETVLTATETAFRYGGSANTTASNTVAIQSSGDIHAGFYRIFLLGGASSLSVPAGRTISIFGDFFIYPSASVSVTADSFLLGSRAALTVRTNSSIAIDAASSHLEGHTTVESGSSLSFSGSMQNIGPVTALAGASLSAGGTVTNIDVTTLTDASITTPLFFNRAELITLGACGVNGSFTNNASATTLISSGTLTVSGTLVNNGIITGEICVPCSQSASTLPPNLTVEGDLLQSEFAGLVMPFPNSFVRVAGDFDAASSSSATFDLSLATLEMNGTAPEQTLEAMSRNEGPASIGLNPSLPGHFPIGTLEVASGATVRLVDNHDNDTLGQAACEAIYVNELRINSGARLINTGCAKIYYNALINSGTVDVPANLIAIGTQPCLGDLNGDLLVEDADFVIFLSGYNILDCFDPFMPSGCPADLNADGAVDDADFVVFVAAYDTLVCP